ncbi:MAG: glycosyltransferase 87 family protein, partial [Gemmatimonadota bacterium]
MSSPQRYRWLVVGGLVLAGLVAVVGIAVPAGLQWDFGNFYDTGHRAASGQLASIYDPTSAIAGEAPLGAMAFWGAPVSAFFYAPLSLFPPATALVLFKLAGTLALAAGLLLLYRHTRDFAADRGFSPDAYRALYVIAILLFQPFWSMYRVGGQTTPFVFLLLVLALLAFLKERWTLVAGYLLLAVLIKPAFAFVPLFVGLVAWRRMLPRIALVFAAAGLVSIALLGWPIHQHFLEIVRRGSDKPSPWPFNSSLYIVADAFRPVANSIPVPGAGGALPGLVRIGLKLLVLLVVGLLTWRGLTVIRLERQRRLFLYLMAISFCLLISQIVWEHYLAVLFIPLVFLLAAAPRSPKPARLHLAIIFGLVMLQNLVLVLTFRAHVPITNNVTLMAVSLVKAGPLIAYLAFLWFHRSSIFD